MQRHTHTTLRAAQVTLQAAQRHPAMLAKVRSEYGAHAALVQHAEHIGEVRAKLAPSKPANRPASMRTQHYKPANRWLDWVPTLVGFAVGCAGMYGLYLLRAALAGG